ncbi:MAG TPA: hypothetical protein DCS17_01675 [Flavobacterium sp.]|nr:hypothetical protein [Flavobacterium sp.]
MNEISFEKKAKIILLEVSIKKNDRIVDGVFLLDTGCSTSVVQTDFLERCNYTKRDFLEKASFTTGSNIESGKMVNIQTISALGLIRRNFKVICFDLPANFNFDGLLGVDFLKHKDLFISFRKGIIKLS